MRLGAEGGIMSKSNFDVCDYCCEWVGDHRGAEPTSVMEDYPKMMRKVLRHEFGLSKSAAKEFVDTACEGNWLKLHETDVEKDADSELYARMILDDVHYCSDRWGYDRVLRIQWLYRRLVWKCCKERELAKHRPIPDETSTYECVCDSMGMYGRKMVVHEMECPECGRTYEHVNGDYERCPHCGTKFGVKDN